MCGLLSLNFEYLMLYDGLSSLWLKFQILIGFFNKAKKLQYQLSLFYENDVFYLWENSWLKKIKENYNLIANSIGSFFLSFIFVNFMGTWINLKLIYNEHIVSNDATD